jgi:hypothetical protein
VVFKKQVILELRRWAFQYALCGACQANRRRQPAIPTEHFGARGDAAILRVSNDSPKTMQNPDRGNDLTMPQTFSRVAQDPYLTVTGVVLADPSGEGLRRSRALVGMQRGWG